MSRAVPPCTFPRMVPRMLSLAPQGPESWVLPWWASDDKPMPGSRRTTRSCPGRIKHTRPCHHSLPGVDLQLGTPRHEAVCLLLPPSTSTPRKNTAPTLLTARAGVELQPPYPTYLCYALSILDTPIVTTDQPQRDDPGCSLVAVDGRCKPPEPLRPTLPPPTSQGVPWWASGGTLLRCSPLVPVADRDHLDTPTSRAPCS